MISIIESNNSCIYDKIVNDEFPEEIYGEVSLYNPTEDWMELQLDYGKFNGDKLRLYGIGGVILKQMTPSTMHVYYKDMDSSGEEHFVFAWSTDKDQTQYLSDGDYELSAEFAWQLAHEFDKIF